MTGTTGPVNPEDDVLKRRSDGLGMAALDREAVEYAYDRLKAYIVSDVHLNNHPYDHGQGENPRRRNFRLFLNRLNQDVKAEEKILLVMNGDILDITGSWFEDVMPWDGHRDLVNETLSRVLREILDNNQATLDELRQLLEHPLTEIIYVFGNHDGMLQQYPESQQVIRDFLNPDATVQERIRFAPFYASEELDLYIEHGHLQDPFNHKGHGGEPPLGDVVNVLIVNRFVEMMMERLRQAGYSEPFLQRMHTRLHDIEYLRPLALLPVWVQTLAHDYERHPENIDKPQAVQAILISVVSEILLDPKMVAYLTRQLKLPRHILPLTISLVLRIPWILPFVSFLASKFMHRTHSNKYQYKAAQKLHREKGYRLIAFGHTHIPGVQPLSESAYYFNTGSWKPVINLFKISKDPVDLEYLNPDVQFNKVERCGILCIEKNDVLINTPAEFSLQTIQSGVG